MSCNRCEIGYCYKNCDKYNEWQERAEAALEKQIPKKPTENCECAVCGIDLVLNDTLHDGQRINYCPMCGQYREQAKRFKEKHKKEDKDNGGN